jgi:hypothetical protein
VKSADAASNSRIPVTFRECFEMITIVLVDYYCINDRMKERYTLLMALAR